MPVEAALLARSMLLTQLEWTAHQTSKDLTLVATLMTLPQVFKFSAPRDFVVRGGIGGLTLNRLTQGPKISLTSLRAMSCLHLGR
mmetsp:Transcript_147665/g.472456  ORF Transcript_147665/g.472456 Transcript_147665/m.472456 type:complete len:85 (+) Transcript_147665:713-967(+)